MNNTPGGANAATDEVGRGRFIVYEGIDGSGTTTQAALLANYLRKKGLRVYETAEPTRGPFGSVIRQVLEGRLGLEEHALAAAFAADRYDHLYSADRGILAQLRAGTWVVCDRYVLSSVAYQAASGLPSEWIHQLNRYVVPPDLTVFIDTPVDESLARISSRSSFSDRYERKPVLSSAVIRYRESTHSAELAGRLVVVNGSGPMDPVFERSLDLITKSLALEVPPAGVRPNEGTEIQATAQ